MKKLLGILLSCLLLQGCGAAVVSGIALAGFAAYDRNNIDARLQDQTIIYQAYGSIKDNAAEVPTSTAPYRDSHIVLTAFHGNVLVVGQVPTKEYRNTITAVINDTDDVLNVYNQLNVAQPTKKSIQAKDSWTTTAVKSAFISDEEVQSADVKVLTENGVVYLMGYVSPAQADGATNAARRVKGVKKVVTLFDYTEDTTLQTTA